jgi:5'-3' exonuclease
MGIKGLNPFLKKRTTNVFREFYLSELEGTCVAIDTYNWIATVYFNAKKHVVEHTDVFTEELDVQKIKQTFVGLFLEFLREWWNHNIVPVFVFDGEAPIEKMETRKTRRDAQAKTLEKLQNVQAKIKAQDPLFVSDSDLMEWKKCLINVWDVPEDFHANFKAILHYLCLPVLQAKYEGEQLCAMLAREKKVSAVFSTDTDVLVYGGSLLIIGFGPLEYVEGKYIRKCKGTFLESILEELKYTQEQFRNLCILAGCDYNTNMRKVAITTAHKLLERYASIEAFPEKYEKECLRFDRCVALFTPVPSSSLTEESTFTSENKIERLKCGHERLKTLIDTYDYSEKYYYLPKIYANIH